MKAGPSPPAYFGGRVSLYDAAYDARDSDGHALRSRLTAVLRHVGSGPGDALDAGMGPGRLAAELARRGWWVSGVDASAEMVAAARDRLPESAGRLHCASIEALPFDDHSFDLVTATGVLEYARLDSALMQLVRVLRPGGRLVVSYPNPSAPYGICKSRAWYPAVRGAKRLLRRADAEMPRGAGSIAPDAFARRLTQAGLQVVARERVAALLIPAPLDQTLPRLSAAVAARLERVHLLSGPFATQIVFAAQRTRG